MKMYRVNTMTKVIEEHEVDRCTDKSIWIDGSRLSRWSGDDEWWDNWEGARASLLEGLNLQINLYEARIQTTNKTMDRVSEYNLDCPSRTSIRGNRQWDLM